MTQKYARIVDGEAHIRTVDEIIELNGDILHQFVTQHLNESGDWFRVSEGNLTETVEASATDVNSSPSRTKTYKSTRSVSTNQLKLSPMMEEFFTSERHYCYVDNTKRLIISNDPIDHLEEVPNTVCGGNTFTHIATFVLPSSWRDQFDWEDAMGPYGKRYFETCKEKIAGQEIIAIELIE